jgi:nucleoside diphosphate kinase
MDTVVKATFTIIDDDEKAKRTEVIEMIYPMDEERNFVKSLIEHLESDYEVTPDKSKIIVGH